MTGPSEVSRTVSFLDKSSSLILSATLKSFSLRAVSRADMSSEYLLGRSDKLASQRLSPKSSSSSSNSCSPNSLIIESIYENVSAELRSLFSDSSNFSLKSSGDFVELTGF